MDRGWDKETCSAAGRVDASNIPPWRPRFATRARLFAPAVILTCSRCPVTLNLPGCARMSLAGEAAFIFRCTEFRCTVFARMQCVKSRSGAQNETPRCFRNSAASWLF
jgi:hypothetical protein